MLNFIYRALMKVRFLKDRYDKDCKRFYLSGCKDTKNEIQGDYQHRYEIWRTEHLYYRDRPDLLISYKDQLLNEFEEILQKTNIEQVRGHIEKKKKQYVIMSDRDFDEFILGKYIQTNNQKQGEKNDRSN